MPETGYPATLMAISENSSQQDCRSWKVMLVPRYIDLYKNGNPYYYFEKELKPAVNFSCTERRRYASNTYHMC